MGRQSGNTVYRKVVPQVAEGGNIQVGTLNWGVFWNLNKIQKQMLLTYSELCLALYCLSQWFLNIGTLGLV